MLTEPFRARTWKETAYALLSLVLGVFWFTVLVTLISVGGSLLVVMFLGVPILLGTIALVRAGAQAERLTAAALLGLHIPAPPRRRPEGSWWRRLLTSAGDPAAWRELLYLLLLLPVGIVLFVAAVVLWSVSLALLTVPAWYTAVPPDDRGDFLWRGNQIDTAPEWIGAVGAGALLLLLTPWILRGLLRLHGLLMRALLGPTRGELEREAARLGAQRDFAVTAAAGDRRQIERDLHDGAQARLVALAVDLGRARRRLEEGGSTEEAAQLVRDAHEDAKLALAEIRDL
ncbi:MAG TPA: sensor domain-containing protein, partial [Gaiellaceae bacterium]|nr:sensor domain-containing protein [Gaiellaceae bacterium]